MGESHTSGWLLCGKPLAYAQGYSTLTCALFGKPFEANVSC